MKSAIQQTLAYSKQLIVSPDIDGFVCAKLLQDYNGSMVVGTYDKNILMLAEGIDPMECLFVDCDMNTPFVSIGNHMRLLDDNMAVQSFNPNVYYQNKVYTNKYPYSTAFLVALALEIPTTLQTKISMSFADSTYKNTIKYNDNMHMWSARMEHNGVLDENVAFVLDKSNYWDIDKMSLEYPKQAFASRRYKPEVYRDLIEKELQKWKIDFLPLQNYEKYPTGLVDKNTVKRYMSDIISYAEIFSNEYSVTFYEEKHV